MFNIALDSTERSLSDITETPGKRCTLNLDSIATAYRHLGRADAEIANFTASADEGTRHYNLSRRLRRAQAAVRKSCGWKR